MPEEQEKRESFFDQAITYSFYLLVFFAPIIFTTSNYELFEFPKMLLVYFFAGLIFCLWALKSLSEKKFTFVNTPLAIPLLLFLGSQILSTIFSIDRHTSIFGYYSRFNGGLLSTFSYLILFFAAVSNLNRTKALKLASVAILSSLFVSLWGIPSHFGYDPSCFLIRGKLDATCWSQDFQPTLRIFSTLGQPNWLAAFLVMTIPLSLAFGLFAKQIQFKIFFFLAFVACFLAFLFTNSRAGALALAFALLAFGGIFVLVNLKSLRVFVKKPKISYLKDKVLPKAGSYSANSVFIFLSIISILILTLRFGGFLIGRVKEAAQKPPSQTQASQPTTPGGTESGQIRLIVWRGALDVFRHYPLFGSGVETFGYSYYQYRPSEHNLTTEWNFLYNKAHNEYLNYLATTGFVGTLVYFLLIIVFIIWAVQFIIKQKSTSPESNNRLLIIGFLCGYLAYLIQNFFGFSIVVVSLLFFLYPALTFLIVDVGKRVSLNLKLNAFLTRIGILFVSLLFLSNIFFLVRTFLADVNFAYGQGLFQLDDYESADLYLKKAAGLILLPEPLYLSYLGYNASFLAQETQSKEFLQEALTQTKKALQISPAHLSLWRNATNTYLELSNLDQSFLTQAQISAQAAAKLAPTDAETLLQFAQVQKIAGNDAQAIETLEKVLHLKPNYQEAKDLLSEW
jgi:tetratricopeptide (TPR) repeat protein